ncbi:MAG TPA: hypothetical protein VGU73_09925, partial [Acidimicrobiia bacterium]|nr:hypothetical protein [Acidimicrobiia bacterium]
VRSWPTPGDTRGLDAAQRELGAAAAAAVGPGAVVDAALDCRYVGQSHELTVPSVDDFPEEHRRRNGYTRPDVPIEVVALRAGASRPALLAPDALPDVVRDAVRGPRVVAEPDCTVWVPEGWDATPGPLGAWVLRRRRAP